MKIPTIPATCALILTLCAPVQAAVLSFDLSGLTDTFALEGSVDGGFTFDTESETFSSVDINTGLENYAGAIATFVDGTGFGLPASLFVFQTPMTIFFFGLDGFASAVAGLDIGDDLTFSDVFAFEADDVTPDFQIGLDGSFAFYFGDVSVTRLEDPVAPVPLPASLPLLIAGLGSLGLATSRRRKNRA